MAQEGFTQCGCCGNLYKSDGSEQEMYDQDHQQNRLKEKRNVRTFIISQNGETIKTGHFDLESQPKEKPCPKSKRWQKLCVKCRISERQTDDS